MSEKSLLNRQFVLTFFSQFSMSSVSQTLMTTLPLYLSMLGETEVEIGVLIGSLSVASLVLRPIIGRMLLRKPEKTFMIWGSLLFAFSSAAYMVAPPFWPFFLIRIVQGVGLAMFNTASVTFIANITPESRRGQSLSYFFLSFNTALALAPTFGIAVVNHFGYLVLFGVCTALSLASLLTAGKIEDRVPSVVEEVPIESDLKIVIRIFQPTFIFLVAHIIWGALAAFFPLYAISQGVSNPGVFFGAYAMVLILGRAFGGRQIDFYPREKIIWPCLVLYVLGMGILAFSKTLPMFLLVALIAGAGHAFLMPCLMAYAIDLAGDSRGPAMGIISAMGDLGMGLGPMLMGIVLRLANFQVMFLSLALASLINLAYFYHHMKKSNGKQD